MIFLATVIVKYMKKNLKITKPHHSEHILPAPWHFVIIKVPLYIGATLQTLLTARG